MGHVPGVILVPNRLYLDTARLGLMSPSAQRVHSDFIRLAGEEAGSVYMDEFLCRGTDDWPSWLQRRYPQLNAWQGVARLKSQLK